MTDENIKTENTTETKTATPAAQASTQPARGPGGDRGGRSGGFQAGGPRGGGGSRGGQGRGKGAGEKRGGPRRGGDRPRSEYDQKSIEVRRVARVVAGGRRFSFSVAMIIGDRKGKVGVGTGKAADVSSAMDKATKDAKKHLITVKLTKTGSIPHEVRAKSSSAIVSIMPAPRRGLVAGTAVRNALELAGITDVSAKIWSGSKNKLNMARAVVKALSMLRPNNAGAKSVPATLSPVAPVEVSAGTKDEKTEKKPVRPAAKK